MCWAWSTAVSRMVHWVWKSWRPSCVVPWMPYTARSVEFLWWLLYYIPWKLQETTCCFFLILCSTPIYALCTEIWYVRICWYLHTCHLQKCTCIKVHAFGCFWCKRNILFTHVLWILFFSPREKNNFINVTYPRLKPPSALRIYQDWWKNLNNIDIQDLRTDDWQGLSAKLTKDDVHEIFRCLCWTHFLGPVVFLGTWGDFLVFSVLGVSCWLVPKI